MFIFDLDLRKALIENKKWSNTCSQQNGGHGDELHGRKDQTITNNLIWDWGLFWGDELIQFA